MRQQPARAAGANGVEEDDDREEDDDDRDEAYRGASDCSWCADASPTDDKPEQVGEAEKLEIADEAVDGEDAEENFDEADDKAGSLQAGWRLKASFSPSPPHFEIAAADATRRLRRLRARRRLFCLAHRDRRLQTLKCCATRQDARASPRHDTNERSKAPATSQNGRRQVHVETMLVVGRRTTLAIAHAADTADAADAAAAGPPARIRTRAAACSPLDQPHGNMPTFIFAVVVVDVVS